MKAKLLATIFAALPLCWPAAGFSQSHSQLVDPLIGPWKCEASRPQSLADRPVFITAFPGGTGFIVSGTDVNARPEFGARSGLPFAWTRIDRSDKKNRYELLDDELLYDDGGLVVGRFPVLMQAVLTFNARNDALDDKLDATFKFYITRLIYDTRSGTPAPGAAIIDEEVVASDPTGTLGSTFHCIRWEADSVYDDLREGLDEPSTPLMEIQ